jgi:hypothetical protein
MAKRLLQSMTTQQLLDLIEDHARLAFKEGKHSKTDREKSWKYGQTRAKVLREIKREVDPYYSESEPNRNVLECSERYTRLEA